MEKISIIVPIYNVEKYIEKTIKTILQQSYENIEVLLINDGSTDNSKLICEKFCSLDKRVKLINKKNGGLSSARNVGIKYAKGELIVFIDGDDYIENDMMEKLYNAIKVSNADIAICNFDFVDDHEAVIKNEYVVRNQILSPEECLHKLIGDKYFYYVTAWNKMYKKDIFKKYQFPLGKIHEDEFIIHHIFKDCKRITTIADTLYHYVQRNNSIMNTLINIKKLDAVYAFMDRYEFAIENDYSELASYSLRQAYGAMLLCLNNLPISKNMTLIKKSLKKVLFALGLNPRSTKLCIVFIKRYLCEKLRNQ